jgi:hypothetical protein
VVDTEEYRTDTKTATKETSVQFSSVQFTYVPNISTCNVEQVSLSSRTSVTIGPESVTCSFLSLDPSVDGRSGVSRNFFGGGGGG